MRELPTMRGFGLKIYGMLWAAALAVAVIASAGGVHTNFIVASEPAWTQFGLFASNSGSSVRVATVSGADAYRSGVRPGDEIVAIDGVPVSESHYAERTLRAWLKRPEGSAATFSTRDHQGRLSNHRLASHKANFDATDDGQGMSWGVSDKLWAGLHGLSALVLLLAAILLFRQRREATAALLSLALLLIVATQFTSEEFWPEYGWWGAGRALDCLGCGGLALVLLAFPHGKLQPAWTIAAAAALPIWMAAKWLIAPSTEVAHLIDYSFLAAGVVAMVQRYRLLPAGAERQQLRCAVFGFAAGIIAIIFSTLGETFINTHAIGSGPALWAWAGVWFLSAVGVTFLAGGLMVSLLRYRLYDADAVITRSAGVAVFMLLLAATFAATTKGMELVFEIYLPGGTGTAPSVIGAALAVVLVTPTSKGVYAWAERRFQKSLIQLRRDLPDRVGDLRETAGMKELLDEVLARIERGVRVVRSAVTIDGKVAAARGVDPGAAAGADFPLLLPLRAGHDGADIGTLLVGPRPDGSSLGKDERNALAEIAYPVARAIQIVMLREERERRQESRFAAIERLLAKSPGRLAATGGKSSREK